MSESVQVALIVVIGWLISVCFHEFSHALVAYFGGDKSVKSKGYLTFNPFVYTDIRLSIILPTIFILLGGIGLPGASVSIRDDLLRSRLWRSLVSAAGPFATFLWIVGMILVMKSGILSTVWVLAFAYLLSIEIFVLILNLLPVPGLDGFGIIEPFFSSALREKVKPLYKYGFTILILLLWVIPGPNAFLWIVTGVIIALLGIPVMLVDQGSSLYEKGCAPVAGVALAAAAIFYFVNKKLNWYNQGMRLLTRGECLECVALMEKVLAKKPDSRAYRLQALAYAELCEKAKLLSSHAVPEADAIAISREAQDNAASIEADSHAADSSKKLPIDGKSVHAAKAFEAINKAIAATAEPREYLLDKAFICHQIGFLEEAESAYKQSWQLNKDSVFCANNLCEVLKSRGAFEEALTVAEEGIKNNPSSKELRFQRAMILAQLHRFDEALAAAQSCLSDGYREAKLLQFIMIILVLTGKFDEKSDLYKEYLSKSSAEMKEALNRVRAANKVDS